MYSPRQNPLTPKSQIWGKGRGKGFRLVSLFLIGFLLSCQDSSTDAPQLKEMRCKYRQEKTDSTPQLMPLCY